MNKEDAGLINIAQPIIGAEENDLVNDVLHSGMLAQGPKTEQLEADFASYCGTKYAIAVNSGTAAIHAALYAAGVRQDDEVITVPFSFIATVNPIIMLGAKPVFVDVREDDYLIDVDQLEFKITDKTKAIVPVHLYGQIADMDRINEIAARHNISVIEDACQAIGAEYKGKKAGSLGTAGCFSLYATKNIMSGEGGVITTNDENLARIARQFRQHGMSGPYQYEHIGYNYRTTDLCAAIAIAQLLKVDTFNSIRQKNARLLSNKLQDIEGITLPNYDGGNSHVFHQYTLRIKDDIRDQFIEGLRDAGVGAGVYYPKSLHTIPHVLSYGYSEGDFPIAEQACREVVSLPIHPSVSEVDIETISATVHEILSNV